jgi:hypothetical protein
VTRDSDGAADQTFTPPVHSSTLCGTTEKTSLLAALQAARKRGCAADGRVPESSAGGLVGTLPSPDDPELIAHAVFAASAHTKDTHNAAVPPPEPRHIALSRHRASSTHPCRDISWCLDAFRTATSVLQKSATFQEQFNDLHARMYDAINDARVGVADCRAQYIAKLGTIAADVVAISNDAIVVWVPPSGSSKGIDHALSTLCTLAASADVAAAVLRLVSVIVNCTQVFGTAKMLPFVAQLALKYPDDRTVIQVLCCVYTHCCSFA